MNATNDGQTAETLGALADAELAEIDALLDALLDLDATQRIESLADLDQTQPKYAPFLRRMLLTGSGSVLDRPPLSADVSTAGALQTGTRLGPWKIVAPAGRGGMGEVFRAERADGQFTLTVAIKRLHAHQSVFAPRFALEREVLARLDHAHIARLVDAGIGEDGRSWFATHWIEGLDLPDWLDTGPSLPLRLHVFCQITSAVAYAHQLLVVHRDIKPGNVRITPQGDAVLLDFGIARMLGEAREQAPTRAPFTPEYAAPEQLRGEAISTLTDVHALGLLLFEMLSGVRAFADSADNLAARVHAICNLDPPPPSEAARKATELPYPSTVLRGDLDAIVLRCLAKQPAERYASAQDLLDDVARHLRREPVDARAPSLRYRVGRFVQRHRLPLAAAAVAVAALVAGVVGIAWQAGIAAAERDVARVEARRQQVLREHLMLVFREGAHASATTPAPAGTSPAKAWLDASVARLDTAYATDAPTRRAILLALGELYFTMNDWVAARALLERYLEGPDRGAPQERALAESQLAQTLTRLGDVDAAQALLDRSRRELPDADALLAEVPASRLTAQAAILRGRGLLDEAILAQQAEIEFRRNRPDPDAHELGVAQSNLGVSLLQANRLEEAREALLTAIDTWRADGIGHNSNLAPTLGNLANIESLLGDLASADGHYAEADALSFNGNVQSAATAALAINHARVKSLRGDHPGALAQASAALEELTRYVGAESIDYAAGTLALAELALDRGDLDAAGTGAVRARDLLAAKLPAQHPLTARAEMLEARVELRRDALADTTELAQAAERLRQAPPLLRRSVLRGEIALAESALAHGRPEEARTTLSRAAQLAEGLGVAAWEKAEIELWRHRAGDLDAEAAALAWRTISATLGETNSRLAGLRPAAIVSP